MKKQFCQTGFFLLLLFYPAVTAFTAEYFRGDIDVSGETDLGDAVIALQVLAGIGTGDLFMEAEISNDRRIGLEEAVYALQTVAGIRRSESFELYDFADGVQGWYAGFSDYPPPQEENFALDSQWQSLPENLSEGNGIFLTGMNQNQNLFMFIKRKLEGLEPHTLYRIFFEVEIASNAASGCMAANGAMGEDVFFKAGASLYEPIPYKGTVYSMNIEKGNQGTVGKNAIILGNIATTQTDCANPVYEIKKLDNADQPFEIISDNLGAIWVFMGTDSAYMGTTALYYSRIKITYDESIKNDTDGDGVPDDYDPFPNDPNEWLDTDENGIGDNTDPDDENDGMPDEWENQYGLNPLFNDAVYDADGDGVINLKEFQSGTNPMNHPPSAPELSFPGEEETVTSLTPKLSVGEYADPDDNYPLASTHWQVSTDPEFTDLLVDEISVDGLRSFSIPESKLTAENTYYWRVRFTDNQKESSDWSPIRLFKTPIVLRSDFSQGYDGWSGGFADYVSTDEDLYKLLWHRRPVPDSLLNPDQENMSEYGLYVTGDNRSDDLFMFIKKRLEGLEPDTKYGIIFIVKFGTNSPSGCIGVGGSPGEDVSMKVGAVIGEPKSCSPDNGKFQMNMDIGQQMVGGKDAIVIGNISNGMEDCVNWEYRFKKLDNIANQFEATTDHNGFLWIMIGTDSGFEATTSLYYTNIEIRLIEKGNIQVK